MKIERVLSESADIYPHMVFTENGDEYMIAYNSYNNDLLAGLFEGRGKKPSARSVALFAHLIDRDEIYSHVRYEQWR